MPLTKDILSETLVPFIVGLPVYMNKRGYHVPQDFQDRFFSMFGSVANSENEEIDLYELEDIITPLAVSDSQEYLSFSKDYKDYVRRRNSTTANAEDAKQLRHTKNQQDKLSRESKRIEKHLMQLNEQLSTSPDVRPKLIDDKELKRYRELMKSAKKEFMGLFFEKKHKQIAEELPDYMIGSKKAPSIEEMEEYMQSIKQGLKKAILSSKKAALLKLMETHRQWVNKLILHYSKDNSVAGIRRDIERLERDKERTEEALRELEKTLKSQTARIVRKDYTPEIHREEFIKKNNRSVQQSPDIEGEILEIEFSKLTPEQKRNIRDYIRENSLKFKTRLTRNMRTTAKKKIDIAETCKKACATGGVPIDITYVQPKRSKAKLIMFLDISGSCKEASELMVTFMHEMREMFPAGCRTYVFVNSLYDVSEIFASSFDADESFRNIMEIVPTKGVYSNYFEPFNEFVKSHISEVTKDTTVIFMGDARNNSFDPGESNIKRIARKAKRAFWLNTEAVDEWGLGDSVMPLYAPYMTSCEAVTSPAKLLNFMLNVR